MFFELISDPIFEFFPLEDVASVFIVLKEDFFNKFFTIGVYRYKLQIINKKILVFVFGTDH